MKTWIERAALSCGLAAAGCTGGPADEPWIPAEHGVLGMHRATLGGAPGRGDPAAPCSSPEVLFAEDFSDNAARWNLAAGWEIGPARPSRDQRAGMPDPAVDHTPTGDNGIAGVLLGGSPSIATSHPQRYLTSPAVDAGAFGRLTLSFWRWLNTTYRNKGHVEVFDGSRWQIVYETPNGDVTDAAWKHVAYDITRHKNPGLRVRFGYSAVIAFGGAPMSGWNLDDVQISACR
ncbi:hypothetical protein [Sorangium sp. So ce131]|uniref:hypothetical protein n=1 Tax=Sorangium sp. So ce131 TaxID=3133282 RepID=UPI003F5F959F